jgi:uncharacterized membrane protein
MARKLQVVPGNLMAAQAWIGAIVASLFLIFGGTFAFVVLGDMDGSEGGMRTLISMFFVIWIVACVSMIIFFVRVGSKKQDDSIVEVTMDDSDESPRQGPGKQPK